MRFTKIIILSWLIFLVENNTHANQNVNYLNDSSPGLQQLRSYFSDGVLKLDPLTIPHAGQGMYPLAILSLQDAQQRTIAESYSFNAAKSKVDAATALGRAAYAPILPSLELRAAQGLEISRPASRIDSSTGKAMEMSRHTRKEVYVVVTQALFDLGAIAEINRAAAAERANELDADVVHGDLTYETTVAFFRAIEASLLLTHARDQLRRLERLGEWITARADSGGASGADRERILARVFAAKSAVQEATAQSSQANITLSRLTNSTQESLQLPITVKPLGALKDAQEKISASNPELLVASANEEVARHEIHKSQTRFLPIVKFELSTNNIANSGGQEGWRGDQRAMVVLTMPLFSGGGDYYRLQASLAKKQQYTNERLDIERTARHNLQIAYNGLTLAHEKIKSLRQQAEAQAKVVKAFDAQLSSTTRNLLDIFDAYQQYYQSQIEVVRLSVQAVLLEQQVLLVTGQQSTTFLRN